MIAPLTLKQLVEASMAELITGADAATAEALTFSRISTDTRRISAGDVFLALRGDNFDGHDFVSAAVTAGAAVVIVDHAVAGLSVPQLVVADTVKALGQIGRFVRQQFGGPVVALTGSCGKTSVKELITGILSQCGQVAATKGNLNNHIGVPFTLLDLGADDNFAVIEMGASGPGEIAYLASLAEPRVTLVNNVMPAHLEGFGSLQGVADAKGEIYQALPAGGTAVVNLDEPFADQWLPRMRDDVQVVTFSTEPDMEADFSASAITLDASGCPRFRLHTPDGDCNIKMPLLGLQQVNNALAAAACAWAVGADLDDIRSGLQQAEAVSGRMQTLAGVNGSLIINDAYNANPGSVRVAIDSLLAMTSHTQHWLVLGNLAELGADARTMMSDLGIYARNAGLKHLLCVGEVSQIAAEAFGPEAMVVADHKAAIDLLQQQVNGDTVVLIKGSRSARMDVVVNALTTTLEGHH